MLKCSAINGVGICLPKKIMTNKDLEKIVNTNDEWITKRTGIKQRHVISDGESCASLGANAAVRAIKNANLMPSDIDAIIVATASSDNAFPSTATVIGKMLGIDKCIAFDVAAACAGFIFALNNADNMIKLGQIKNALVIGTEVFSKFMDWQDRNTCVLFGDGAGAVVVSQTDSGNHILSTHIFSDCSFANDLKTSSLPNDPDESKRGIFMDGKVVYKFAVRGMTESVKIALEKNNYTPDQLDFVVPHQANLRIIETVANNLKAPMEKIIVSIQNHANTSAATIPLALNSAIENKKFKSGDLIALTAMGAGFCWGSALLKWK